MVEEDNFEIEGCSGGRAGGADEEVAAVRVCGGRNDWSATERTCDVRA